MAERHAALTQTVELMAHTQQAIEKRHEEAQKRNEEAIARNQTLIAQIMESIMGLARIAQARENRISGLESI